MWVSLVAQRRGRSNCDNSRLFHPQCYTEKEQKQKKARRGASRQQKNERGADTVSCDWGEEGVWAELDVSTRLRMFRTTQSLAAVCPVKAMCIVSTGL